MYCDFAKISIFEFLYLICVLLNGRFIWTIFHVRLPTIYDVRPKQKMSIIIVPTLIGEFYLNFIFFSHSLSLGPICLVTNSIDSLHSWFINISKIFHAIVRF